MTRYRKFLTALIGVVVSALLWRYGKNNQLVNDIVLAATAMGVYAVPND